MDLKVPAVAWPTLALLALVIAGWLGAILLGASGQLPPIAAALLGLISAFAAFTPAHEAVHRSISRADLVNTIAGRIGAMILLSPFTPFRYVHLEHHKHTNDDARDPDMYSGRGPQLLLPLRWMTQELYYWRVYLGTWRGRSAREQLDVLFNLALIAGTIAIFVELGLARPMIFFWLLPARVAIALLAWSFDYVPHRPHQVRGDVDRFRATHIIRGVWLTLPLLYQNYHLIHHLYPGVPFYRYARIWRAQREELLAKGARVMPLIGR